MIRSKITTCLVNWSGDEGEETGDQQNLSELTRFAPDRAERPIKSWCEQEGRTKGRTAITMMAANVRRMSLSNQPEQMVLDGRAGDTRHLPPLRPALRVRR